MRTPQHMAFMAVMLTACQCTAEPMQDDPERLPADRDPPRPALVNGDFRKGLEAWDLAGMAASFRVFDDPVSGNRPTLTTFGDGGLDADATGTVSQVFTVPDDAVALRFLVHGGRSMVRLYEGNEVLEQAMGMNDNLSRIPVSWDLHEHRGVTLRLAIEDNELGGWGFVSVSGFDVTRDVPPAIVNMDFADGLNGWDMTGDAQFFMVFRDGLAGNRWSITTAPRTGPHLLDKGTGTLSQTFRVPDDALALRFFVHGGHGGYVRLWDHQVLVYSVSGVDSNSVRAPVSWDLEEHRGKVLRLAIEDPVAENGWGFIGVSGFDLITLRNGP